MKLPLIALALLAVSCGEYKTAGVSLNKVGEIRAITSTQAFPPGLSPCCFQHASDSY